MLRIVPHAVSRVCLSYQHLPDGFELHFLRSLGTCKPRGCHTVEHVAFVDPICFGCHVTKLAPYKVIKLVARGKLTFDERFVLHCVVWSEHIRHKLYLKPARIRYRVFLFALFCFHRVFCLLSFFVHSVLLFSGRIHGVTTRKPGSQASLTVGRWGPGGGLRNIRS